MPVSYDDFLLDKYGELPDDSRALKRGLRKALAIIGAYEVECRNIESYVTPENMGQGFCQGEVFREAIADVFWAMETEPVPS